MSKIIQLQPDKPYKMDWLDTPQEEVAGLAEELELALIGLNGDKPPPEVAMLFKDAVNILKQVAVYFPTTKEVEYENEIEGNSLLTSQEKWYLLSLIRSHDKWKIEKKIAKQLNKQGVLHSILTKISFFPTQED